MQKLKQFVNWVRKNPMITLIFVLGGALLANKYWLSGAAFLSIAVAAMDADNDL